jgi:signal transduction histidine kinase
MNAVLGFAQLLGMANLPDEDRECVERILAAGGHLLDLINDVLDMSSIESGTLSVTTEPVVVSHVLSEALALVGPMAEAKEISITSSFGLLSAAPVLADRKRLRQVALNLLANAVKYNDRGGAVHVSCRRSGRALRVEVTDTGPGVDESLVDRLFVPFDRLGAERQGIEGTGLGLPLSRRLIEAMGGRLDVTPGEHGGCTFFFELQTASDTGTEATPVHRTNTDGARASARFAPRKAG